MDKVKDFLKRAGTGVGGIIYIGGGYSILHQVPKIGWDKISLDEGEFGGVISSLDNLTSQDYLVTQSNLFDLSNEILNLENIEDYTVKDSYWKDLALEVERLGILYDSEDPQEEEYVSEYLVDIRENLDSILGNYNKAVSGIQTSYSIMGPIYLVFGLWCLYNSLRSSKRKKFSETKGEVIA